MVKINIHSRKLKSNIEKMPAVLQQSIVELAEETKQWAITYVPVDTGALRKSIRVIHTRLTKKGNTSAVLAAGGLVTTKNRATPPHDYAQYVEDGTENRDGTMRTFPYKYMASALEAIKQASRLEGVVRRNLSAAFTKASGRYDIYDVL